MCEAMGLTREGKINTEIYSRDLINAAGEKKDLEEAIAAASRKREQDSQNLVAKAVGRRLLEDEDAREDNGSGLLGGVGLAYRMCFECQDHSQHCVHACMVESHVQ